MDNIAWIRLYAGISAIPQAAGEAHLRLSAHDSATPLVAEARLNLSAQITAEGRVDGLQTVTASRSTTWDVLKTVTASRSTMWSVEKYPNSVTARIIVQLKAMPETQAIGLYFGTWAFLHETFFNGAHGTAASGAAALPVLALIMRRLGDDDR